MTTYEPGSAIADYRIDSLIGRGGMAVVYRAEDMRLGRKVALKLLTPDLADSEQFRLRFIQESRMAASLDHPNIVPIYEAGEADGQLYIAMRYVAGPDLKGLLADQGGQLPLDWAVGLFGQIGDALDSAHRAGLVHRDVKPANILIAESQERPDAVRDSHVYLTDFGLTKRTSELSAGLTSAGHFLGTVDYVSPEQIQGKPVGPGADIYALGCVLYECLTGLPPFRRDDDAALLWAHLVGTPPPIAEIRPEVPVAVSAVVARAMAKDPADRYQSCEELVSELEAALDVPVPMTTPGGGWTPDIGAATHGADATSDSPLSDGGTVAADKSGGGLHASGPIAGLPAPADAPYETAQSADHRPVLRMDPGSEPGCVGEQREPVAGTAPLSVEGDRPPVVAAASATPSVPTEGPRPSASKRRRPAVRLVVVGLLALVLGADAAGASRLDPVGATSVVAERADSAGGDPFAPPPVGAASESAPPADGGSTPDTEGGAPTEDVPGPGDTMGIYGGTGADACSASSLATFFDTHPDRAAAWARAQGIHPSDIRSFLRSLTPVVLSTDTAVTNHGFRDGRANAYQAVLQAGTAVLVDEDGVPRVRCACGNPLDGPSARRQVRYTGQAWPELGSRPVAVEAAPVEDPANAGSGGEPTSDGSAGSREEPATDGSDASGDAAAVDGSAGTGGQPATDGSAGSGEVTIADGVAGTGDAAAADGSAGTGEATATDRSAGSGDTANADRSASAGTGEEPATDGSAGSGDTAAADGSAGSGEVPAPDGSAGSGDTAAADGSAGSGDVPAPDGSAGSGQVPATDGSAASGDAAAAGATGSGDVPAPEGSAGSGDTAATDGSEGSGELPTADGSAGSGEVPTTDASTGTGEEPATDGSAESGDR
ncbi:serine/threonine-protein kinase [Blastococcus sp. CT_GayMR19]|uniref:serine/threonine-protein kinase n=1 Tax=Blastococcus sp. CT_GayMR19 TaxID=2559608 RepID=UPI001ADDB084|nr:serine/threonine-protein kinase [Blastococcus sp. CT_GayMR19]